VGAVDGELRYRADGYETIVLSLQNKLFSVPSRDLDTRCYCKLLSVKCEYLCVGKPLYDLSLITCRKTLDNFTCLKETECSEVRPMNANTKLIMLYEKKKLWYRTCSG